MIHQTLERSDDPASQCYLQKSPSQLPSASWTQHLCTGKIKTKTKTKSFAWTTAITGRPNQMGPLRSVSHFTPPLISIHAFFPRSFTTDHLTVGCNTAWQSLRSEQIVTIHPHTVLAPRPLCKYPGDDCFQVTTWPPENAHGSSPCIYPYVKWVKAASLKHII